MEVVVSQPSVFAPILEAFEHFLDLGRSEGATVMIHGVDPEDMTTLLRERYIRVLRREKRGGGYGDDLEREYLAGDVTIDGVNFTLFSGDLL